MSINLNVILKDRTGVISHRQFQIGLARLLKHIGIGGDEKPFNAFFMGRGFGFLRYFLHYIDHPHLLWMPFRFHQSI